MANFSVSKFNGEIEHYNDFILAINSKLREHELYWITDETTYPNPFMLGETLSRLAGYAEDEEGTPIPPTNEDMVASEKFKQQRRKVDTQSDKALNLIVGMLGTHPTNRTEFIRTDTSLSPRQMVLAVLLELKNSYGTYTPSNELRLRTKAIELPNAFTMEEIEQTAYSLIRINKELTSLRESSKMTNAELKAHLNSKNQCEKLEDFFDKMNDDDNTAWTFDQVLGKLKAKITQKNNCKPTASSRQPAASMNPQLIEGLTFATYQARNKIADTNSQQNLKSERVINCHNCHQDGHGLRECKVPICRNCNSFFTSTEDKDYHTMDSCPQPRKKIQSRSSFKRKLTEGQNQRNVFTPYKRTNHAFEETEQYVQDDEQFDDAYCNNMSNYPPAGSANHQQAQESDDDDDYMQWSRAQTSMSYFGTSKPTNNDA